jgi:hypothetical protein
MFGKLAQSVVVASVIGLPVITLAAPEALAAKDDFYVYNSSRSDIYYLYISEASMSEWGNDVLGDQILYSGTETQIQFGNMSPSVCLYDFRAETSAGQVVENYQINVCTNDYFEIFDQ